MREALLIYLIGWFNGVWKHSVGVLVFLEGFAVVSQTAPTKSLYYYIAILCSLIWRYIEGK